MFTFARAPVHLPLAVTPPLRRAQRVGWRGSPGSGRGDIRL